MILVSPRYVTRAKAIVAGGLLRFLTAFSNLLISVVVIRMLSPSVWGEVVYFLLLLDLSFTVISWGHAPYLDREFSVQPKKIKENFANSILARSILLFLFLVIILLTSLATEIKFVLVFWSIGRYLYQSFESVNQFERNYVFSIIAEVAGLLIITIPIVAGVLKTEKSVLMLFASSFIFRGAVSALYYRKFLHLQATWFRAENLKLFFIHSFPFFLLSLSGMLLQRIDLYCVAFIASESDTAQYQVFINLLLVCHLGGSLLLSPFTKNIFRLQDSSIKKLQSWFIRIGAALSLISIALIYLIIKLFYEFDLPPPMYIMGYFHILTFYVYLLKIYKLRKKQLPLFVVLYSFIGCAINLIIGLLLIPLWSIQGAMFAGIVSQIVLALLYFREDLNIKPKPANHSV